MRIKTKLKLAEEQWEGEGTEFTSEHIHIVVGRWFEINYSGVGRVMLLPDQYRELMDGKKVENCGIDELDDVELTIELAEDE